MSRSRGTQSASSFYSVIFSLLGLMVLVLISNWIAGLGHGYDYDNYVRKIYHYVYLRETGFEILETLYVAKDISFALVVELSAFFDDRVKVTFTIIVLLSLLTKYYAALRIVGTAKALVFLALYLFLISPNLEFAAIRTGLALGLFMLAISFYTSKLKLWILILLSVASHSSMLIAIPFLLSKVCEYFSRSIILSFFVVNVVLLAAIFVVSTGFMGLDSIFVQFETYRNSQVNLGFAMLPVVSTFVAYLVLANERCVRAFEPVRLDVVVFGLCFCMFSLILIGTSASGRFIQVVMTLLLLVAVDNAKSRIDRGNIGFLLLVVFMALLNVIRGTWKAILDPTLFY